MEVKQIYEDPVPPTPDIKPSRRLYPLSLIEYHHPLLPGLALAHQTNTCANSIRENKMSDLKK